MKSQKYYTVFCWHREERTERQREVIESRSMPSKGNSSVSTTLCFLLFLWLKWMNACSMHTWKWKIDTTSGGRRQEYCEKKSEMRKRRHYGDKTKADGNKLRCNNNRQMEWMVGTNEENTQQIRGRSFSMSRTEKIVFDCLLWRDEKHRSNITRWLDVNQ